MDPETFVIHPSCTVGGRPRALGRWTWAIPSVTMTVVRKRAWWSGFVCGVVAAGLFAVVVGGELVPEAEANGRPRFDRDAFHQALDAVLDRYVEPVDESTLLARGLKHIVAGLDGHSHFLTAAERKSLRKKAKSGTTGLVVHLHTVPGGGDRMLEVVGVLPDSPGARAKLSPGDRILEIDGTEVGRLLSQVEAETMLAGKVGDVVAMRVQRRAEPHPERVDLKLGRASSRPLLTHTLITAKTAAGSERTVVCIELRAFGHGVGEAFKKRLAQLRRSVGGALAGVVLDLRGNPGGEVDEALVVADLFVADGILTRTRGRGGRILREERAHEAGTDSDTPLVILQDRHSASAAELLTAALRDHGRAKSVGERSYGKGTVQEILGLSDGSVLKLTIARYFSPKDQKIDGVGIEPDVALPSARQGEVVDEALRVLGLTRA